MDKIGAERKFWTERRRGNPVVSAIYIGIACLRRQATPR